MKQIHPPFRFGDRVMYRDSFGLVLDCKRDSFDWDVNVLPERDGEKFWVGSDQLLLARKDVA